MTDRVYTPLVVGDLGSANPITLLPGNINLHTVKNAIKSGWYRCIAQSPKFTMKTYRYVGFLLTGELSF